MVGAAVALLGLAACGPAPSTSASQPPRAAKSSPVAPSLEEARAAYPAAARPPQSPPAWKALSNKVEAGAPGDEAAGGVTARGVSLARRVEACFPTDARHLFSEIDKVVVGTDPEPRRIDFADGGVVSAAARAAIQGQNTWMLWGEGNEAFWGWVQENGYGIADFLILLDSRERKGRFSNAGLMNQPGMIERREPLRGLGLYIDQADEEHVKLSTPDDDIDAATNRRAEAPKAPPSHDASRYREFFEIDEEALPLYEQTVAQLANDGVDPRVYGYASGVIGLRLMPNPDFFGKSESARAARRYWNEQVANDDGARYYKEDAIRADPKLVRPLRVSMACSFCHVGPHPLAPPPDVNNPGWGNMSSTIGNQYWTPSKAFSNLKDSKSFLWQFVASQQPGTIDTSLVSTDHINNPATINAIWEFNARLDRARVNPPEQQSEQNLRQRGIEDSPLLSTNPRHTPRVLLDGADSIGVEAALSRVYVNIGAYSEQWRHVHNPIIGFAPQRPFELATTQDKSVYWRASERFAIPQLEAYFTFVSKTGATATQPMKLAASGEAGRARIARDHASVAPGRAVFVRRCAVCHSSKQPPQQQFRFSRDWQNAAREGSASVLTMPMDFAEWEEFIASAAFRGYVERLQAFDSQESAQNRELFADNYLSTDVRVPVTLVGTNSQRAVATNAMRGQVWDNFSSETYKSLPAVGPIRFYNPFKRDPSVDAWGNNDSYAPPGGGPGYYRPASLVSLWATAPLLHNNALGRFKPDPSVTGRLAAFDESIDQMLDAKKRAAGSGLAGDLRASFSGAPGLADAPGFRDPGFIYRTTERSYLDFRGVFIRPLLNGVLGERTTSFLTFYLWLVLAAGALVVVFVARARLAGNALALLSVLLAVILRSSGIDTVYPWLWAIVALVLLAAIAFFLRPAARRAARLLFAAGAVVFLGLAFVADRAVDGRFGDVSIGPIPKGTPVNLVMNLSPDAPPLDLYRAISGLTRGILRVHRDALEDDHFVALAAFQEEAGEALLKASKCPDFVLDRGHWFANDLSDVEKAQLKAFLETL